MAYQQIGMPQGDYNRSPNPRRRKALNRKAESAPAAARRAAEMVGSGPLW